MGLRSGCTTLVRMLKTLRYSAPPSLVPPILPSHFNCRWCRTLFSLFKKNLPTSDFPLGSPVPQYGPSISSSSLTTKSLSLPHPAFKYHEQAGEFPILSPALNFSECQPKPKRLCSNMNTIDSTWLSSSQFQLNVSSIEPLVSLRWNHDGPLVFSDPFLDQQCPPLSRCFEQIIWSDSWPLLSFTAHLLPITKYTSWLPWNIPTGIPLSTPSSVFTWLKPSDSQDLHCLDAVTDSPISTGLPSTPHNPWLLNAVHLSIPWVLILVVFPRSAIFIFHLPRLSNLINFANAECTLPPP